MRIVLPKFHYALYFLLYFQVSFIYAQTTSISGVINTYTEIISVDAASNSINVIDPSAFSDGDTVLIIKMQGAIIAENDNGNFGDITNLNATGAYEQAVICTILGNNVSFQYQLINNYTPLGSIEGKMQMIKIPQYHHVNIVDTLKATPWNGSTGGVLVFKANSRVTLNAPIDVSGMGFRGGNDSNLYDDCFFLDSHNDYYYPLSAQESGKKGEGIAMYISGKEEGRGKQANGGGGGNDHNTGGGGGSNYGVGGIGGTRNVGGFFSCKGNFPGEGGLGLQSIAYSSPHNFVFMGGGGGVGHINEGISSQAGHGGGIVIILADTLDGNGFGIYANGKDGQNSGSDGAPGGGGGGTILISAQHITSPPLTVQANGGMGGGSNYNYIGSNCEGSGGGGGGGVIWSNTDISNLANIDAQTNGGINGVSNPGSPGCPGANNGATAGTTGAILNNWNMPLETMQETPCILSVGKIKLSLLRENNQVKLQWTSNAPLPSQTFNVERSIDGKTFEVLTNISSNKTQRSFEWIDIKPISKSLVYYRIRQINTLGAITTSNIVSYLFSPDFSLSLYPNPLVRGESPKIQLFLPQKNPISLFIYDELGRHIQNNIFNLEEGSQEIAIPDTHRLAEGIYYIKIFYGGSAYYEKLVVR